MKIIKLLRKSKKVYLATFLICLLVSSLVIFTFTARHASAVTDIDTTTSGTATDNSQQRRAFYDNSNSLFWTFYNNGSAIEYSNSTSGSSWTSRGTIAVNTNDFSVWYVDGTTTVYIAYIESNAVKAQKGTLASGSITWGGATTVENNFINAHPVIVRENKNPGKLWIFYYERRTSAPLTITVYGIRSTNTDDITAWTSRTSTEGSLNTLAAPVTQIAPLATAGDMLAVWTVFDGDTITDFRWSKWTDSNSSWSSPSSLTTTSNTVIQHSLVGYPDTNGAHLIYDDGGTLYYKQYTAGSPGSWGSATDVSGIGVGSVDSESLTYNSSNSKLYAFYTRGSNAFYKSASSPYTTWSSTTTLAGTGTNRYIASNYAGACKIIDEWTETSGLKVSGDVTLNNCPPNAPTLSAATPNNGSTVTSTTPSLPMTTTDADGDTIKYDVLVYNTSANNGTNCSGSLNQENDQNSSGTGWDNGTTAYSSGATATYTVQGGSALNRGNAYCWQAKAKDPSGTNTFSSLSTPSTFTVNSIPAAPTLSSPAASATNISTTPQFILVTTEADNDYLKYKILIYSGSGISGGNCTGSLLVTADQTSSQTGWSRQDQQTSTAYTGSSTISGSSSAYYTLSGATLTANTAYCWQAQAIDPGGSNTFSSSATAQTFTTGTSEVKIQGGTSIVGGTSIQ